MKCLSILALSILASCVSVDEKTVTEFDCVQQFTSSVENLSVKSDMFPAVNSQVEIQATYLDDIVVAIDDGSLKYIHQGLNCRKTDCRTGKLYTMTESHQKDFVKGYVLKNDANTKKVLKNNLAMTVQCLDSQNSPAKPQYEIYLNRI